MKRVAVFVFALLFSLLTVIQGATVAAAQETPPPPADPSTSWWPPLTGAFGFGSRYASTVLSTGGGGAFMAWFTDLSRVQRSEFCGSDVFYFWIQEPYGSLGSIAWVYEYYPPGSSPDGHWVFWWVTLPSAGAYVFGPYTFETLEPEGDHTWRIWIYDTTTASWVIDRNVRFTYIRGCTNILPTSTRLTATSQASVDAPVAVTSTIEDYNGQAITGGTVTVSYATSGAWTPAQGCQGAVEVGAFSCSWTPPEVGRYLLRADYSGYTTQQTKYQSSSSPPVPLEVQVIDSSLSLTVMPTEATIDPATLNATVQVFGNITAASGPLVNEAIVLLTFTSPEGQQVAKAVTTDASGHFSYALAIDRVSSEEGDTYAATASWQGDTKHRGASVPEVIFLVKKVPAKIAISLSQDSVTRDIILGASPVNINGSLEPGFANAEIKIDVEGPAPTSETLQTDKDGAFSWSFTPDQDGNYKITVSFAGDDQHTAESKKEELTVTPGYWTIGGIIAVIIIVGLAIAYLRGAPPIGKRKAPRIQPMRGLVCPSCGVPNRPGATFCRRCSTSLRPGVSAYGAGMICPICRTSNRPTAGFCRRCGRRLR